jgi:hypothetical protein
MKSEFRSEFTAVIVKVELSRVCAATYVLSDPANMYYKDADADL